MRKSILLFTVLLLITAAVAIFLRSRESVTNDPWQVISSNAICVIESDRFDKTFEEIFKKKGLISTLHQSEELVSRILSAKSKEKLFLACYSTSSSSVQGIFIIKNSEKSVVDRLRKDKEEVKARTFSGFTIADIYSGRKIIFSYSLIGDILVIGPSFLIEDAIRTTLSKDRILFKDLYHPLFQLSTLESDNGNIYINAAEFLNSISKSKPGDFLNSFTGAALTDFKLEDDQILFNGFSIDSIQTSSLLSLFKEQRPGSFGMKNVISSQSDGVLHYYLSDPSVWYSRRLQFIDRYLPSMRKEIEDSEKKIQVDFNSLKKYIGDELAVCYQGGQSDTSDFVFVMKVNGNGISDALKKVQSSQATQEQLGEYMINEINAPFFVRDFLWPVAPDRAMKFYTSFNNYILFSPNREILKDFLSEISMDNTLSKSLEWNKFLSSTIQESTVSFFFTGSGVQRMSRHLRISSVLGLDLIDKGSIQFNGLDKNFSLNSIIQLADEKNIETSRVTSTSTEFQDNLNRSPEIVMNHSDKSHELFLQDSLNQIYLISNKNEILWKLNADSDIRGKVSQIDFYRNNKLQYFFTTKDQLNLVDRLGRAVKGFPLKISQGDISFSKVIDYDRSRNYRFMIVEKKGNVYLFDKEGKAIEGWNPKVFSKPIVEAGQYRLLSKDYFFFAQEDGIVHLYNRKSELLDKFPVHLKTRINHCFYVRDKQNDSGYFAMVSEDGFLFNLTTSGEIVRKEPLLKNSTQSHFQKVNSDKEGVNWIARVDKSKIALFDQDGKMIFEIENPASENLAFDYFHSSKPIFSVFDPAQELLILLDKNGKEIIPPMEATQAPAVEFLRGDKAKLNYVFKKQLRSVILPF